MQRTTQSQPEEKLIRLLAPRRERQIELRVHYEVNRRKSCKVYRIITIAEVS